MKAIIHAASLLLNIAAASSLHDHNVVDARGEAEATCSCPTYTVTVYEEASCEYFLFLTRASV